MPQGDRGELSNLERVHRSAFLGLSRALFVESYASVQ
jgi:hypothetical protein